MLRKTSFELKIDPYITLSEAKIEEKRTANRKPIDQNQGKGKLGGRPTFNKRINDLFNGSKNVGKKFTDGRRITNATTAVKTMGEKDRKAQAKSSYSNQWTHKNLDRIATGYREGNVD